MMKKTKYISMILVNLITITRFIGAIILPFIYHKQGISITAIIVICLYITDSIDGVLARKLKVTTFFGSIMDGISDKLLNFISFVLLGLEYNIMFCPLIIEIAIFYTFYSTYRYGGNIQSSRIGKNKTIILALCVILSFILLCLPQFKIHFSYTDFVINIFGIITSASGLYALYDYMYKNKQARENPDCIKIKNSNKYKKKKAAKLVLEQFFDIDFYVKHKDESILKLLYM